MKNMYSPCFECKIRYSKEYSKECDSKCDYANLVSKLKTYGGVDEVLSVMEGERIPIKMIDKEHIEDTFRIVNAVKEGII